MKLQKLTSLLLAGAILFAAADRDHEDHSTVTLTDTRVYDTFITNGISYTGADFGIENGKIFMLTVENVPDNATFYVRPFAVDKNGNEVYGSFNAITVISVTDGELTVG